MRTHGEEVILTLDGHIHEINAVILSESLRDLARLVEGFPTHAGSAKLATLREGSAITGVLTDYETTKRLADGIAHLRRQARIPDSWSISQVRSLERIVETGINGRGASLKIAAGKSQVLDLNLKEAISKAITRVPKSVGSVVGELKRYNGAGQVRMAGLQQEGTGNSVDVSLDENLWEVVIKFMHQRVEVAGILTRHPETNVIESVRVRSITELPKKDELTSGLGICERVDPYDVDPVEIIRTLRDG